MRFHNRTQVVVLVVVVFVVSTLFLGSASAVALPRKLSQPDDLILKLCKKTEYVDICIKYVTENIKGKPTGISILNAEINASIKFTKAALAQVANLTPSASKQEKHVLDTCKENFKTAVDSLKDAKTSITSRDAASLNVHLSASLTYVITCEDAYAEFSIPSRLKDVDQLLYRLAGNNLDISTEIVL